MCFLRLFLESKFRQHASHKLHHVLPLFDEKMARLVTVKKIAFCTCIFAVRDNKFGSSGTVSMSIGKLSDTSCIVDIEVWVFAAVPLPLLRGH